jgi:glycosyltransferase involved in cell wall biosynthesis
MEEGLVEWRYIIAHEDEDSGHLLRNHGEVSFFSGDYEEAWWKFFRVVMDFRPHVVHASYRVGAEFAKRAGLPCVCTVHGIIGGDYYGSAVADISVGVSSSVEKGTDGFILNGVVPLPLRHHKNNLVVWLGRTDKDRHPIPFLEALMRVPEAKALIIGRSCQGEIDMRAEIASRGLGDRVELYDDLTPEEARIKASEASIVIGAVNESFGMATAELMTSGVRPVVVQGPGYQSKMAERYGVIVRPTIGGLVDGIKTGLKIARERPEESRRMAEWARREFDCRRMSREYYEVYRSLERKTIDIVVMAWNELEVTKSCVNSILANTWTPFRLILLDNGSEEPVYEYFQSVEAMHPNVVAVRSEANLGCPGGREFIFENFPENEFFFWLDNDMLVPEGWLGPLYDIMRSDPMIGAVSPWNTIYMGNNKLQALKGEDLDFHGSNNLYRRSAVEAVKEGDHILAEPFRSMSGRADSDLLCRLKEGGYRLLFDGKIRLYHLGGPLHKGNSQGLTRRHGNIGAMFDAEEEFGRKWKSFGNRRSGYVREPVQ